MITQPSTFPLARIWRALVVLLTLSAPAAIAGGTLATGSHATKAGTRALINTSPEPFSNWVASVGEDLAVIAGLWTALYNPVLFIVLLVLFILLMIWLLPKIWRGLKTVFGFLSKRFGAGTTEQHDTRERERDSPQ